MVGSVGAVVRLAGRNHGASDLEMVALRHHLPALRRQVGRPGLSLERSALPGRGYPAGRTRPSGWGVKSRRLRRLSELWSELWYTGGPKPAELRRI